eukprot:Gb_25040 [translate_table: standard]
MAANASSDPHTLDAKHKLYEMILSFAKPMTLKAAVLLNIPDIIASEGHGASLSLQQIAAHISPPPQSMEYLLRILRFLASYDVFTESVHVVRGEEKQWSFGLTAISELLVQKGNQHSLAPFLLLVADKFLCESYHHLDESVLEGCSAFNKVYSKSPWEYLSEHPNCNKTFNDAMVSHTCALMASALKIYDGFKDVKTVVDVGGGVGTAISIIVKHHTHLKGINFDLPHVIDTAPAIPGVEHVGGNMFEQIPPADAVFIKSILHDWNDEHCVRILKKCREAIPENGKVIIVETVVERNEGSLRHLGLLFDIGMMTFTSGGKERTEEEFKVLFEKAGFKSYALLNLPAIESIIEVSKV